MAEHTRQAVSSASPLCSKEDRVSATRRKATSARPAKEQAHGCKLHEEGYSAGVRMDSGRTRGPRLRNVCPRRGRGPRRKIAILPPGNGSQHCAVMEGKSRIGAAYKASKLTTRYQQQQEGGRAKDEDAQGSQQLLLQPQDCQQQDRRDENRHELLL